MARQQPDFSFERDGRPLGAWLRGLAGEDATARRAAGEALQAMLYGVPSVHTDLADIEWGSAQAISEHGERFKAAIRAAVETPGFDARGFVHELILYRMALRDDWHRRMAAARDEDDAPNTCRDRLLQRLESADGDGERSEALRRYLRWVCANMARSLNRGRNAYTDAESIAAPGFMSSFVFDSLDELLLADRPGLHAMLADEDLRRDAARALARIGPPAVDFASVFFEELDAEETARYFGYEGAPALGSIGRDDAVVIDGLLRRLRSGSLDVRAGAAAALEHAGPPLAGRLEIALDLLLGATYEPGLVWAAVPALASVGRDREAALRRVLEVAEPRPPRWKPDENFPDHQYDEVMIERGAAIDSLTGFRRFADRVVPVLVAALDTFEEYDPDRTYRGEHERVCAALEPFGPQAAPAVPRIVRFLEEWPTRPEDDREWPTDVFRLLAAIGPPAAEALPLLEQLRAVHLGEDESPPGELDPDDPLDRAIVALRGAME